MGYFRSELCDDRLAREKHLRKLVKHRDVRQKVIMLIASVRLSFRSFASALLLGDRDWYRGPFVFIHPVISFHLFHYRAMAVSIALLTI